MRDAVLFRAHAFTPNAAQAFNRLVAEAGGRYDIWLVGYCKSPQDLAPYGHSRTDVYNRAELCAMPYTVKLASVNWDSISGHNDLPVLRFYRAHPGYRRYWVVEYDVRYTGHWQALLDELAGSDADLLGTTVQSFHHNPNWANWEGLATGDCLLDRSLWIKSFVPFAGLSNAALAAIDLAYGHGWTGHYEATWPTIVSTAGLKVEDIGSDGPFTPPHRRGRFYTNSALDPFLAPGSFVFRPDVEGGVHTTGDGPAARAWAADQMMIPDMLVHPVK